MMPWKWNIAAVTPKPLGGFAYPSSGDALVKMLPLFFSNLDGIGNAMEIEKIAGSIVDAVRDGETKFNQAFGGWMPNSNEFGIAPLRPKLMGFPDSRWIWTDSASATLYWSAEESFISTTLDTDELVLVFGLFNYEPTPNTLEIFIQPGANKLPIWNLEAMRAFGKPYMLFPDPIIIEPRSVLTIKASARSGTTQAVEEMGLLGYQFCPLAKLITERWTG